MDLIKKPVTGMKDVLPREMALREYILGQIKETYRGFGFTGVETPALEHIENLSSRQGGDNEKLIFKILKRGEKLVITEGAAENDLADGGLRYDLTLPLARFYSANEAQLPKPFKALQIGSVWRAERPQKGRFRQFTQCDIDILGEGSFLAEVELLTASAEALLNICPRHPFTIRVNDRRLLAAMAQWAGLNEEESGQAFIILDKLDKIGRDGVRKELTDLLGNGQRADAFLSLFEGEPSLSEMEEKLSEFLPEGLLRDMSDMMSLVSLESRDRFLLRFDPTLVRGMGYYTGTIFEVSMEGFGGSVAGGGRYDGMISRFTGKDVPACGISIGFERIIAILLDEGFLPPEKGRREAWLLEKGLDRESLQGVFAEANRRRREGETILTVWMNKNKRFQKEQLLQEGYEQIREYFAGR